MTDHILTAKDYQAAIDVQTACNLGAVVHSFSRVMKKIQQAGRGKGTEWVNTHPISVMYATQISFLANDDAIGLKYSIAYETCEKRAKKDPDALKFEVNETVIIKKYKDDEENREGRIDCIVNKEEKTYWVCNMNMPFCGTVSAEFKESDLEKII